MTRFVKYVLSPGTRRVGLVQSLDDKYEPVKDPYRQMRLAVQAGRRTGRDEEAMTSAIQNCRQQLRGHYTEIANGWLAFVEQRKSATLISPGTARWHTADLTVKVTPDLVLAHPDGITEALKLHMYTDPLSTQGADVMLWLMQQTLDQTHPEARPMVLDVRRRKVHSRTQSRPGFSSWLESEAASLAFLYRRHHAA
ncbi:hypothetical protein [Micromonospora sp. NBC_01638]|uniref:hypothetical protein n=1 Tax=Micromonospora sp. NBC_01638 TaxID=2975982 RepID=UPI003870B002|nr:hypothetical protein OG811_00215 [Micromonospora sp. NBC_01638]